jgi:hypothetical protein
MEQADQGKLLIYPNPATNMVIIDAITGAISAQAIQVFDANGRSFGIQHARKLSDHSLEINISGWAQGTYFIRAKVGDSYQTFTVIKKGIQ